MLSLLWAKFNFGSGKDKKAKPKGCLISFGGELYLVVLSAMCTGLNCYEWSKVVHSKGDYTKLSPHSCITTNKLWCDSNIMGWYFNNGKVELEKFCGASSVPEIDYNDISKLQLKSWVWGYTIESWGKMLSKREWYIISADIRNGLVSYETKSTDEMLDSRRGKYYNIIYSDNKVMFTDHRDYDSVMSKYCTFVCSSDVRSIMKRISCFDVVSNSGIQRKGGSASPKGYLCKPYSSAYTNRIEAADNAAMQNKYGRKYPWYLYGSPEFNRYPLLKGYGQFRNGKLAVAIMDILMSDTENNKGYAKQFIFKGVIDNVFYRRIITRPLKDCGTYQERCHRIKFLASIGVLGFMKYILSNCKGNRALAQGYIRNELIPFVREIVMNKHTGLGNKFNTGYIMGKCDNGRIVEVSLVKDAVGKTICAVMAEGLYADIQWLYDNYVTGVLNALYDNAINRHAMSDMATTYTKCYFGASNIPAIQIMSWAVQLRYTVLNPPIFLPKG